MGLPLEPAMRQFGLPPARAFAKRAFDIAASLAGLAVVGWLVVLLALMARFDTGQTGLFRQKRIGLYGDAFTLLKIRTMRNIDGMTSTVTTRGDPRITRFGAFLRRYKLDELPQLVNVLVGTMSFVGPRPDVSSVYAGLDDAALRILTVRPGITGPASLAFRNEEELLAAAPNPERYNIEILFPQKIRLNLDYIDRQSFTGDLTMIVRTVFG